MQQLPYAIKFRRNLFTVVQIDDVGIHLSSLFRKPRTLPWKEIQVLDISGLQHIDKSWLKEEGLLVRLFLDTNSKSRFFLIMSDNTELLKTCAIAKQTWLPGINVLSLTDIDSACADELYELLAEICVQKSIKRDTIVLDY